MTVMMLSGYLIACSSAKNSTGMQMPALTFAARLLNLNYGHVC